MARFVQPTSLLSAPHVRTLVQCTVAVWFLADVKVASGQEPTVELPEVVVTATRTRTRAADVTTSITVINADEITQRDDATVTEALNGAPGVNMTDFGALGQSSFASIRGSAPDQVLVMLDGVEVNNPAVGQFDFANLTTDSVDRIEVLRGSGGTLYGSAAIGGVINVLTRRGEGPPQLGIAAEGGRWATNRETLSVSGSHGPVGLSGTLSFLGSDGFLAVNNSYQNFSTVWRADADLLPSGTLTGIVRYTNSRAGLPNFNVSDGVLDPDAYDRADFFLAKGAWEQTVADNLTYHADVSYVSDNQRWADVTVDQAEHGETEPNLLVHFPTEIIQADAQVNYLWGDLALSTLGLEFQERSAHISQFDAEGDEGDPRKVEPETTNINVSRSNVAVFAQEQLRLLDGALRGVGGVRYDHYDQFGDHWTFSGSGTYLVEPTDTRLRLSYAQGFRAPTFSELFEPGLGNPNLQAETSWEIDAGFTQECFDGRLRFEPTYFFRNVHNLIEEVADQLPGPIKGVPEGKGTFNVNAQFQGVELIARAQPTRWLTLSSNYTYLNIGSATGEVLNRPRHLGSFAASSQRADLLASGDRATAVVQVFAVGSRTTPDPFSEPEPFAPGSIGGYARTDVALAYQLAGRLAPLTVTATVRNLFNRNYSTSIGFPAPPAWFLIGLRYQL